MDAPPASLELVLAELQALRGEVRELRQERAAAGALLSTDEAAALLRLSPAALLKRVARGQVQAVRLGRHWRFRRRDLGALLGRER